MPETTSIAIADGSGVGEARRAATRLGTAAELDATDVGRAALVVTELVWMHAHGGQISLQPLEAPAGLEILALDRGPGIPDVGRALDDGYSTAGTAGTGLGAIERQSQTFEIWTGADGTGLLSRVRTRGTRGAAVALADLDRAAGTLVYAGLGNIAGFVVDGERSIGPVSSHGTAGAEARKSVEQRVALPPEALVLLASDGVRPRWQLSAHPGLWQRDPAPVAGMLFRDFASGRDDATVLALRAG